MTARKDEWLGRLLGKPAYHIDIGDLPLDQQGQAFFDVKIPVGDVNSVIKLQTNGFFLADTNIQLVWSYGHILTQRSAIRFARADDEMEVRRIACESFTFDRFHRDPGVDDSIASKIKEAWVGNFFSGHRGRWMVVAESEGRVVGFALLLSGERDVVTIDLIAVAKEQRGRGVARDMIAFAVSECLEPGTKLKVGTQVANIASLALYGGLGFRVAAATYVFHFHQQG
jgi:GNAT superfamily N-acetyltransferase